MGSALTQTRVRETVPGPASPPRVAMWTQARAGAGQLFSHPDLARVTLANAGNNAAVMAANTLLPVIALKDLGLAPGLYAGLGACGALAGIAGAGVASQLTTRLGLRGTRILTADDGWARCVPVRDVGSEGPARGRGASPPVEG